MDVKTIDLKLVERFVAALNDLRQAGGGDLAALLVQTSEERSVAKFSRAKAEKENIVGAVASEKPKKSHKTGAVSSWRADKRARRVPNFVIEQTGLKKKEDIQKKYGEALFQVGKSAPAPKLAAVPSSSSETALVVTGVEAAAPEQGAEKKPLAKAKPPTRHKKGQRPHV